MSRILLVLTLLCSSRFLNAQVGIGTVTPDSKLEIKSSGSSAATRALHVKNASGNTLFLVRDDGNIGIGTSTPGAALDLKGAIRLLGSSSGFVGLMPSSAAGSTIYTLPSSDGTGGQVLSTNGSGLLGWTSMPSSSGTVTSVGLSSPTGGISISGSPVTSAGTLTLNIATASASQQGLLSAADWNTFNSKQNTIILSTTGNSGAATFNGSALNIPTYNLEGLGGVPTSRTININGTVLDLGADRSWTIPTHDALTLGADANGLLLTGQQLNLTLASTSTTGALSNADWNTFNSKQNTITLSATGNSGAATFNGSTLNIPTYNLEGLGGVPLSRKITINGTELDLSADRSFSVGSVTSVGLSSSTVGIAIGGSPVTSAGELSLNIATASASQQGLLSAADWNSFNSKVNISDTASMLSNYIEKWDTAAMLLPYAKKDFMKAGAGISYNATNGTVTNTGIAVATAPTINYLLKFSATNPVSVINSSLVDDGTNMGLGIAAPVSALHIDRGSGGAVLKITSSVTGQAAADGFDLGIDADGKAVINQRENNDLIISTNNTPRAIFRASSGGQVEFSGSLLATAFFETSDVRQKNIIKRDGDVIYFTWKDKRDELLHIGYVAQEVQEKNPHQVM